MTYQIPENYEKIGIGILDGKEVLTAYKNPTKSK